MGVWIEINIDIQYECSLSLFDLRMQLLSLPCAPDPHKQYLQLGPALATIALPLLSSNPMLILI